MKKRWSPPPKGETGSGVFIEAAKLDAPEHKPNRRRLQLYRDRDGGESAIGCMVRAAISACGGEVRP